MTTKPQTLPRMMQGEVLYMKLFDPKLEFSNTLHLSDTM